MKDRPTIVPMPDRNELKAAADALRRQMPELIEHAKVVAQIRRASYLAHIEEGFNEAQALELCKSLQL